MKRSCIFVSIALLCTSLSSCLNDDDKGKDREKIVEMTIYPETGYGVNLLDDIWTEPLVFSDSDENQRRLLLNIIVEGFDFDYERGYEYKIRAKKVWMHNPPQDVSSVKYVFMDMLSKTQVIMENREEDLELFISSEIVKFTPSYPNEYEEGGSVLKTYNAFRAKLTRVENWVLLTNIEGFDFENGYEYILNVKKVTQATPYSVKYILRDVLSKEKKD
jgi:hypothetical protein